MISRVDLCVGGSRQGTAIDLILSWSESAIEYQTVGSASQHAPGTSERPASTEENPLVENKKKKKGIQERGGAVALAFPLVSVGNRQTRQTSVGLRRDVGCKAGRERDNFPVAFDVWTCEGESEVPLAARLVMMGMQEPGGVTWR